MLAVILMACVSGAIAYPFVQKRLLLLKAPAAPVEVIEGEEAPAAATAPAVAREELCPHCSRLNPVGRRICVECGGAMPVVNMSQFWQSFGNEELIREGVQAGVLLLGMVIAMLLANFLPPAGKTVILLLTIGALGYRLMHALHN
jgi:hypothetical protein